MNNNIKEHPIRFEADMIRALLQEYSTPGGYKNQARRTCGLNQFNDLPEDLKERLWRSGRDSNPRYRFCQYVPLAKECFQPLSHRSVLGNVWRRNYTLPKMKSTHK